MKSFQTLDKAIVYSLTLSVPCELYSYHNKLYFVVTSEELSEGIKNPIRGSKFQSCFKENYFFETISKHDLNDLVYILNPEDLLILRDLLDNLLVSSSEEYLFILPKDIATLRRFKTILEERRKR